MNLQNIQELVVRLLSRYGAEVFNLGMANGLQPADCDNLNQEVFLRVHRALLNRCGPRQGNERAWILTIARHQITSMRRTWCRRPDTNHRRGKNLDRVDPASATDTLRTIEEAEEAERLGAAIEQLPPRERAVLEGKWNGRRRAEIARELACSKRTCTRLWEQVLIHLRADLADFPG